VTALRDRGLRSNVCRCAEPGGCERQFKQETKAVAIKHYLAVTPNLSSRKTQLARSTPNLAGPATNFTDRPVAGGVERAGRLRIPAPHRADEHRGAGAHSWAER